MSQNVYFNGEILTIPGAYSAVDTSQMTTKSATGATPIAIIGESTGGEPGSIQFFSEPTTARKVLKSGELLKACEKAFNPVSGSKIGVPLGGANVIAAIRTNQATKSKYVVQAKGKDQLVLQSKDWGAATQFQVSLSDSALAGTRKMVIFDQATQTYETLDHLGNLFAMAYIGDQDYAELNVFMDGNSAMVFQTKVGSSKDDAVEDIQIKLDPNTFKNIRALINELKSYENYVVSDANSYNYRLKVTDLDLVDGDDLTIDDPENPTYRVTALYADIQSRLDTDSQLIEVGEYNKTLGELENFGPVMLEGGSEGLSPASWVKFFDMLSNYDISYIVPLNPDPSIHAELQAHITAMSGQLGRERRGIVGGAINETVDSSVKRARDLSSDRMQVVHGGFWDVDTGGVLELYPPYILAAQHAGRAAYLEQMCEAATHDVYRMSSPEYKLERNQIIQLLNGGVIPFEFVLGKNNLAQAYTRLVQDLTTDIVSQDTVHTERAVGALADSLNKEMRDNLDSLLTGKRATLSDLTSAKNVVISVLQQRQLKGHILEFKDVSVIKDGMVIEVNYSVAPAEPNNFTLITAHFYSMTLIAE